MKTILMATLIGLTACTQAQTVLNGAGASFPAPVYQNWTYTYSQSTPGVTVNYQSIGSGAGLNQIREGTIDFAGSDNPLTLEEQTRDGLQQFPTLAGGVVVIVNLPGIDASALRLSRNVLADIFLGKIISWNDPRITELNPGLKLPRMKITVVRRADASGTSFIFTHYLSQISEEWKTRIGFGGSVKWPVGIGGQKNPGVCNSVAKIRGAIGYTEYTYALEAKIAMPQIENREGKFLKPTPESFQASAASADWENAPGFYMVLTDQPGEAAWPITGITYVLIRKDCPEAKRAELVRYFNWCFSTGQGAARKLHYVPLPENLVIRIQQNVFGKAKN